MVSRERQIELLCTELRALPTKRRADKWTVAQCNFKAWNVPENRLVPSTWSHLSQEELQVAISQEKGEYYFAAGGRIVAAAADLQALPEEAISFVRAQQAHSIQIKEPLDLQRNDYAVFEVFTNGFLVKAFPGILPEPYNPVKYPGGVNAWRPVHMSDENWFETACTLTARTIEGHTSASASETIFRKADEIGELLVLIRDARNGNWPDSMVGADFAQVQTWVDGLLDALIPYAEGNGIDSSPLIRFKAYWNKAWSQTVRPLDFAKQFDAQMPGDLAEAFITTLRRIQAKAKATPGGTISAGQGVVILGGGGNNAPGFAREGDVARSAVASTQTSDPQPMISLKEFAKRSKRDKGSVARLCRDGKIPGARKSTVTGDWEVPKRLVVEFRNSKRAKPQKSAAVPRLKEPATWSCPRCASTAVSHTQPTCTKCPTATRMIRT